MIQVTVKIELCESFYLYEFTCMKLFESGLITAKQDTAKIFFIVYLTIKPEKRIITQITGVKSEACLFWIALTSKLLINSGHPWFW